MPVALPHTSLPSEVFPPEVLRLIATHLEVSGSLYTLLQLALASKRTFETAAPALYKTLYFTPVSVKTMELALARIRLPKPPRHPPPPQASTSTSTATTTTSTAPAALTPNAIPAALTTPVPTTGALRGVTEETERPTAHDWLAAQAWHASPGIRLLKCFRYTEAIRVWDEVLEQDGRQLLRVATAWNALGPGRNTVLIDRCKTIVVLPDWPPLKADPPATAGQGSDSAQAAVSTAAAEARASTGEQDEQADSSSDKEQEVGAENEEGEDDDEESDDEDDDDDDDDEEIGTDDEIENRLHCTLAAALEVATAPKHICDRQPLMLCHDASVPVLPQEEIIDGGSFVPRDTCLLHLRDIDSVETVNCHDVSYRPFDVIHRLASPKIITVSFSSAVDPLTGPPMESAVLEREIERYHRKRLRHLVEISQITMLYDPDHFDRQLVVLNPAGHLSAEGPLGPSAGAAAHPLLPFLADEDTWESLAIAEFEDQYDAWEDNRIVPTLEECKARIRIVRKGERDSVPLCPACGEPA